MKMTGADEHSGTSRYVAFSEMNSSELNIVSIDHCYCKPWSSHPDASNTRPLHMLFMESFPHSSSLEKPRFTDVIDVVGQDDNTPVRHTAEKGAMLLEHEVSHSDYADSKDDWEDHITSLRGTWSVLQNRIFAKVMRVLQADRLARLSVQGIKNELVQRRLHIDKAARRVRFCFGNVGWDMTLILWLHNLLLDNLRGQLLTSYLEVLLTLKSKIPSLVERLVQNLTSRQGLTVDSGGELSKMNWDSLHSNLNLQKLKKLPDNPVLLLISTTPPSMPCPVENKRQKLWQHHLSALGKVVNVAPDGSSCSMQTASFVESLLTTTRAKILEVKRHFVGRPVVLIGWHIGALVAVHVAVVEFVSGIVCLGFPTTGINGDRGEVEDPVYTCKTPTLFVIGQHANTSSVDTLENIREKLRLETSLLLVGGADDHLRISHAKKLNCNVTQTMVDRYIMDEMFSFLGNILSQHATKSEITEETEIIRKQRKRKHKNMLAACSQAGNTSQQLPVKTVRSLKIGNGGTLSFGIQRSVAGVTKIVKKAATKKHTKASNGTESGIVPSKKRMLNLAFPIFESSTEQTKNISKVSEAAAIASAPELSNLLQSMHNPGQHKVTPDNSSSLANKNIGPSSTASTSTTALTLSRFLASSGFYKTGALTKTKDISSDVDIESGGSQSNMCSFKDEATNEQLKNFDGTSLKQQSQILLRTGTSSVPFSIPLTFTMTGKVIKSSPVMKVTGTGSELLQSQQLSKSVSGLPLNTSQPASLSQVSVVSSSSMLCSSGISSNTSSSVSLGIAATTSTTTSSSSVPPTQVSKSAPTAGLGTAAPAAASIIHIGGDTVFMKETFPSSTSVPGTVSIDLGQIAAGTSGGGGVMRLATVPKISLIPTVKQIAIPELTERLMLAASTAGPQPSVTPLSSTSQPYYSPVGKPPLVSQAVTSLKSSALSSSNPSKAVSAGDMSTPMMTLPSSHLLPNLSSSAGLIALKLSPQSVSTLTSAMSMTSGKNYMDEQDSAIFLAQQKDFGFKSCEIPSSIRILSTVSAPPGDQERQQKLHVVSSTSPVAFSPSSASLIITSGSSAVQKTVPNTVMSPLIAATSQLVTASSPLVTVSSPLVAASSPLLVASSPQVTAISPLLNVSASSEPLGQVTSLLESSPITMGNKRKLEMPGNPINKLVPPSTPPSSSATASIFMSHDTGSLKSNKSVVSSYIATPKPTLPTVASTRTRRIKTPKQYDL